MPNQVLIRLFTAIVFFMTLPSLARAQTPDPAQQVMAALIRHGYDVVAVGYYTDAKGNQDPQGVYVQIETIVANPELEQSNPHAEYLVGQLIRAFTALSRYYPQARTYYAVLRYDHYLYIFKTTAQDWEDWNDNQITTQTWLLRVMGSRLIYDANAKKYLDAKDFLNQSHLEKNQQNKNFTGLPKPPLPPANTNPGAQAENIWFEASTSYLPADGTSEATLMANLRDRSFAALPGREVYFAYEAQGQSEARLGTRTTDVFGTARTNIKSSRALKRVLLRAGTPDNSASSQVLIGDVLGSDAKQQANAVIQGLKNLGYADVDAGFFADGSAIAQMRVASNRFDQKVYSQMVRMLGTLRTVYPTARALLISLLWSTSDGHHYRMIWVARPDYWDAFVAGALGENQLWQSMVYRGTLDEKGVWVSDKDFVYKNFGAAGTTTTQLQETVSAALTTEEWGTQLTVGTFQVSAGGYADSFALVEMSEGAQGFNLFATPDFMNPIYSYKRGDNPDGLKPLRLEQGQYVLDLIAAQPPARVTLKYIEHLAR